MPDWIKAVIREPIVVHPGHTSSRTHSLHADTEEVTEEVRETFIHHNRIYQRCSVDRRIYLVPIDEDETIRLRIQYDVLAKVFDGRSIFPPMGALRRVLDCGFGTGMWAFQVAWENPGCEAQENSYTFSCDVSSYCCWGDVSSTASQSQKAAVIGIDVSPHHYNPEESVENLYLNVDNLNMPLSFPSNHFDLVNSRLVAGGIDRNRWQDYMCDILRCLRKGGWCQMVEIDYNAQSDNGRLTDGHALRQWSDKYSRAMSQLKNVEAPRHLGHWMRQAGFTEVEERNPREFDIGVHNQENVRLLLGSLALYPFTELLNMTITEFHVLVAQARAEASNPALKKAAALKSAGTSLAALTDRNLATVERQGIRRVKADAGQTNRVDIGSLTRSFMAEKKGGGSTV
ncbi:S-adenosyl-L-methionine-dependent methyltransferase [Daldinia caldariorum]|uniref:S-adenosyl-L-methionine-dependent methyltransferase n=1 Tax=Daldinia caldariorum TaxID=326644 RepID=UPI002008B216|nr:S-adenosyl-L-methionine-dependent methyltransferase [Daldinia caldariorum]KAI1470837.1 S-adenosyl-L-methionine-dependent methyltransferase [Daldinia caldariorum]